HGHQRDRQGPRRGLGRQRRRGWRQRRRGWLRRRRGWRRRRRGWRLIDGYDPDGDAANQAVAGRVPRAGDRDLDDARGGIRVLGGVRVGECPQDRRVGGQGGGVAERQDAGLAVVTGRGHAFVAYLTGQWKRAVEFSDQARDMLRTHAKEGTWE